VPASRPSAEARAEVESARDGAEVESDGHSKRRPERCPLAEVEVEVESDLCQRTALGTAL
jgi:hypothetical protein